MSRRSMAAWSRRLAVVILVVVSAACASTTVISEGTLDSPAAAAGSGDATASAPTGDETPAPDRDDASDTAGLGVVDDEQIVALAADCQAGSDPACDLLYQASALGSTEEDLARTCAGRAPENQGFCTVGVEPSGDGIWFDDASPGLATIEDDCVDGDLTACDFLYFRSAVGSPFEEVGTTCGGRIDVAVPDCRIALGDS